jgi:hypothetical protein
MAIWLAFLPQHVWTVGATAMAVILISLGVLYLTTGNRPSGGEFLSERALRVIAYLQILIGMGIGAAAFLVHSEIPCAGCKRDHWGGTAGIVILCVWLALLGAVSVARFRKYFR